MSDVFIAHVEEDADVALEIALGLEEAGYTTWCYEVDSIPGPSYLLQTAQAVEQSKAFVLVISPHSVGSRQVTKEIVRAHESGAEFIPVRRGITHIEFQNRQPEWREAVGAAASIEIPPEGVAGILPRMIDGLKKLGIRPGRKTSVARIAQVRQVLDQLQGRGIAEKVGQPPVPIGKPELESVTAEIPRERQRPAVSVERPAEAVEVSKSRWFWAGIALLLIGFGLALLVAVDILLLEGLADWDLFIGVLLFLVPLMAGGIYCLRRGMAQTRLTEPVEGTVPNWWWWLPVVLAFVGGIIAWAKQKEVNRHKAMNMLTLGIIATFIWTIGFFAFVIPATPPGVPVTAEVEPTGPPPVTPEVEPTVPPPETPETMPPAPSPQLMYEDDFSNPASGWPRGSREEDEFNYEYGEYHILVKKFDSYTLAWNWDAGLFTDFALEIDARLISGPNQSGYGVVFRLQDADNCYSFEIWEDGYYDVWTQLNDEWIELQSKTKSGFIKQGNSTNHLKVVCRGSQIEVYVNGHHLTTVTDDSFAEGYVGMIAEWSDPNTRVAFDNIRVYSSGEEIPEEGIFADYSDPQGRFFIDYPTEWHLAQGKELEQIQEMMGEAVVLVAKADKTTVNILREEKGVPEFTETYCQSVASYLDQDLAEEFADFMKVSHETMTVAGVKALDYTYTCTILGDTLTSRQVQLAVKGVLYTITFQAESDKFDEVNRRYFQPMIDSFQV